MRRVLRPVSEQTVLITGATDGLGRALAAELAAEGATLLVHGRDDVRGRETIDEIHARTGNENLHWLRADFASLDEVRKLAQQVIGEHDRLDVLVNNAGIGTTLPGGGGRMESRDGYELRFAVNYLAGYLLTRLVLPLLEDSAPARIVNVSSAGQAPIDFDDVCSNAVTTESRRTARASSRRSCSRSTSPTSSATAASRRPVSIQPPTCRRRWFAPAVSTRRAPSTTEFARRCGSSPTPSSRA
jgi:NAD(P)-dependent dehydrogenase (short-subunit alcohol dehydrogenase family)